MPNLIKIEAAAPAIPTRKKVAAYARVSMQSERMLHSLSAQISYYSGLIQKNPEWEYVGVYADDFISGTDTVKRDEFNRMLADCEKGKIDIVLTKSISRFARNTVDLLETVRNKNDINNNYNNKSSSILHPSSEETSSVKTDGEETGREESEEETVTAEKTTGDTSDYSAGLSYPELVKAVKEKIDYDVLASDYGDREVSIFPQLIAEMLYKCRDGRQIVVGNNTYQPEILKARYLEVDLQHIRHIMFLMQEEHISPRFVRNYYVQALYDAPVTMDAYYARRVDHDMNCGLLAVGA